MFQSTRWLAALFVFAFGNMAFAGATTISNQECLECHGDSTLTKITEDEIEISLFVDEEKFATSMHGSFECVECHTDVTEIPHEEELKPVECGGCHVEIEGEYLESFHGQALLKGAEDAPQCFDCHGNHYIQPQDSPQSMVFASNLPQTCAKCHADPRIVKKYHIPIPQPYEAYKESIHFKAIEERGITVSATCNDCHGSHDLKPAMDPKSRIYRYNIPETCSRCHYGVYEVYMESVHGKAVTAGVSDSPVCTDCHTEHSIQTSEEATSTVYPATISKTTCPRCHEAERIVTKYGLAKKRVQSYFDSYHGLADKAGSIVVANCASCHGIHNIRPSSDPKSTVNKANLPETCGKCHPGISLKVAKGSIHLLPSPKRDRVVYYVTVFYICLIVSVIGGMVFHNGLDFLKKTRAKFKGIEEPEPPERLSVNEFVRLSLNERIQHIILFTSFFILIITGFALKFPEAWWVTPIVKLEGGFALRGLLHRVAAGVFVALALYHLYYIIAIKRGREQIKALLPGIKDIKDLIQMLKYYLGLSREKARFARFGYIEKSEYWALVWGTIIMSISGFILWFDNLAMRYFPKWVLDVATVVHYYEAILATLAIIVWHFYYVFFNPDIYPMNFACLTGKISEAEMAKEHPLEYEEILKRAETGLPT